MIISTGAKFALVAMLGALVFATGWTTRSWKCTADLADYQTEIDTRTQALREQIQAIQERQATITAQSSQRLDEQQAEQQKEIVYVDKQVIQYRDRWRDRTCQRPADWVQLYNRSLFGAGRAVPGTADAGRPPASAGL